MRRGAWVALLIVLLGSSARAHLGHVVMRAERYLKLDAEPGGVRLVVSLTLGPNETVRVAEAADRSGDGVVSPEEADAYMRQWAEGLGSDLPVEVDGEPVAVVWGEPFFDPVGPIRAVPGAVEMVAHVPLEPGRHRVSVLDRMRVEAFDRTDVAFEGQPGTQVLASGPGVEPTERLRAISYGPANVPDRLTLVVEVPGLPRSTKLALGLAAAALVLVVAGGWWRRRRRGASTQDAPPERGA